MADLVTIDTDNINANDLKKALGDMEISPTFEEADSYYTGDHWQNGDGWSGPIPEDTTERNKAVARISRQFQSRNVIKEVVDRPVAGVLGYPPIFDINPTRPMPNGETPNDNEREVMAEYEAAFKTWFDERGVIDALKEALRYAMLGRRGVIRLYIPAGKLDNGALPGAEDFKEALSNIYVECVPPSAAGVYENPDDKRRIGIYSFKRDNSRVYEVSFLNEQGETVIGQLDGGAFTEASPIQLFGNLLYHELKTPELITPQTIQQQKGLNKDLTMWFVNLDWAGFLERTVLNAMPPGEWTTNEETGEREYKKGELNVGPGTTNFWIGQPQYDEQGRVKGMTNPSVQYRDPVTVDTFEKTEDATYRRILNECKQGHIVLAGESSPSGKSRQEAREDYRQFLEGLRTEVEGTGRWLINTALRLARIISGGAPAEPEYEANFKTFLNVGPVDQETVDMTSTALNEKLISRRTAMQRIGVRDVDAELKRIDTMLDDAAEVLAILSRNQLNSPTLTAELVDRIISDVDILEGLEPAKVEAIKEELQNNVTRRAQEQAVLPNGQ